MQQRAGMGGAPMMGGGGPSMMGMMGASMAGSLAGNAIAHQMMGGHGEQQAPPPAQPAGDANAAYSQAAMQQGACASQYEVYGKCVEANQDVNNCMWAWDMVSQCRAQNNLV
jgi:hypothetical protein